MTPGEKRKENAINKIMEEQNVSREQAERIRSDFYASIGARGGANKTGPTGFALFDKEKHLEASRKGGKGRKK